MEHECAGDSGYTILEKGARHKTVGRKFHKREGVGEHVRDQYCSDILQVFTVSSSAVSTYFLRPEGKTILTVQIRHNKIVFAESLGIPHSDDSQQMHQMEPRLFGDGSLLTFCHMLMKKSSRDTLKDTLAS